MGIRSIIAVVLFMAVSSSAQAKRPPSLSTVSLTPTAVAPAAPAPDRFMAAVPPVLIGTGLGAAVFTIAAAVGAHSTGWTFDGFAVGAAVGGVAFVAAPTIAVMAFTGGLAPWTSAVVPLGVVVAGGAGVAVGLVGGVLLAIAITEGDCICGDKQTALQLGTPIAGGVLLGGAAALGATALGAAFAEPVGIE